MKYITTSCPNCGYKTRSHESGVPSVQIGAPILPCPKCGQLVLDTIQTEYEFMTDSEKARFSTQSALPKSYIGNILFIALGIFLLIGGFVLNDTAYLVVGLIGGIGCIAIGVFQIVRNHKIADNATIEQAVYESLQRTKNSKYVEYIKTAYQQNGIKRNYLPYTNKATFIEQHKAFELRESYKQNMQAFNQLLESFDAEIPAEKTDTTVFMHH